MAKKELDRLTQENAAALAAGMSYGKWKVKQALGQVVSPVPYPAPAVAAQEKQPYTHICEYCGTEYYTSRSRSKYCCEGCRREAVNQRERERRNVPYHHICEYCGKEFVINTKRRQRYCGEECRELAHLLQMREHGAMARLRRKEQLEQVAEK